jgi:membrane protease YdiL (CAAX protease family)
MIAVSATPADRPPTIAATGLRGWAQRHPVAAFFTLAYALSWLAWIPAALAGASQALLIPGAFGPAAAALIIIRTTGGSVGTWARQILHWRARPRYYLYALGLPALLWAAMNLELALLGEHVDLSLLRERLPGYLGGFALVALLGGGQEEPGWRGFALPRLQQRITPLRATLLLAVLWGIWHLPLYGPGFVGPMFYAFFYTYLYNKTGSVGLCMLLHGSFTAALDNLILTADSLTVDLTILATLVAATVVRVAATRGRLGYQPIAASVTTVQRTKEVVAADTR